jgi:hypothetical protein
VDAKRIAKVPEQAFALNPLNLAYEAGWGENTKPLHSYRILKHLP